MDKQTHGPLQTLSKKSRTYTQKMFSDYWLSLGQCFLKCYPWITMTSTLAYFLIIAQANSLHLDVTRMTISLSLDHTIMKLYQKKWHESMKLL